MSSARLSSTPIHSACWSHHRANWSPKYCMGNLAVISEPQVSTNEQKAQFNLLRNWKFWKIHFSHQFFFNFNQKIAFVGT